MTNRVYDVTLAAAVGASQRIDAGGALIKVLTCSFGAIGVKLDSGPEIILRPGQGVRMLPGEAFRDVIVRNTEAVAKSATVFIGDSRFEDSTVSGVVEVMDGGRSRTLANQAFLGYVGAPAGGGAVPCAQLLNPAASGKRLLVKAMRMSTTAAGTLSITRHAAALAQGPYDPANKRLGGATSSARMYRDLALAAAPGTTIEAMSIGANAVVPIVLQEPIVIEEAQGLVVSNSVAASTLTACFEFVEESLT